MGSCGMTPGLPGSSGYLVPLWVSAAAPGRPLHTSCGTWMAGVPGGKESEEGLTPGEQASVGQSPGSGARPSQPSPPH